MAFTFDLADVQLATNRLPTIPAADAVRRLISPPLSEAEKKMAKDFGYEIAEPPVFGRLEAASFEGQVAPAAFHGLAAAVHHAFDEHRPLRLTPDQVWITIEQGLAIHVRENAEQMRARFVDHEGQLLLDVRRDDFVPGAPDNDWPGAVDDLVGLIRKHIGKKHDLFVVDFSTSDPVSRTVSSMVLMDAMQRYFRYQVTSACGIPRVTLSGSALDWKNIHNRVQYLRELDLGWWVDAMEPVLEKLVATAEGNPDRAFWNSLYKRKNASGGPYVTGWVQVFYPYCGPANQPPKPQRNMGEWLEEMDTPFGGGPKPDHLPPSLSAVPFVWSYLGTKLDMELLGGFLGVTQDDDGTIAPKLGWAVRQKP